MPPNRTSCAPFSVVTLQVVPGQQLFEAARADAEQGVVRETQFRFRNQLEIHQLFQRGIMRGANVLNGNAECGIWSAELRRIFIEKTFDGLARFRIAGAAVI